MRIEKLAEFSKVKDGIAYGWAIVSTIKGEPYVDLHGDWIPPETIAPVAAEFMSKSRVGKDMHEGDPIADVVFCLPVDGDVEKGIGLRDEQERTGLVIGWKPSDPAILAKIANGERVGFSIGGVLMDADEEKRLKKQAPETKANQHKRTFRSWKLLEISLVDEPAQEGALVGIVKRKPLAIAKSADKRYLTDEVQGHQHEVSCWDGGEAWMTDATAQGAMSPHRHTVTRGVDGTLTVLADSGHTHTLTEMPKVVVVEPETVVVSDEESVAAASESPRAAKSATVNPQAKEAPMNELDELKALKVKLEAKIAELEAANAELKMDAELTDEEKAYLSSLAGSEAKRFRALEKNARREEAQKARAVEYTADDGTVYRKSDDPRMIALAKRADEESRKRIEAEVSKRVGEFFKGAPGKPEALKDLLIAAESIKGEIEIDGKSVKRSDEAVIALKALTNNAVTGLASKAKAPGFGGSPSEDDGPEGELEKLIEAEMAKSSSERPAATKAVMATRKGADLYAQIQKAKKGA